MSFALHEKDENHRAGELLRMSLIHQDNRGLSWGIRLRNDPFYGFRYNFLLLAVRTCQGPQGHLEIIKNLITERILFLTCFAGLVVRGFVVTLLGPPDLLPLDIQIIFAIRLRQFPAHLEYAADSVDFGIRIPIFHGAIVADLVSDRSEQSAELLLQGHNLLQDARLRHCCDFPLDGLGAFLFLFLVGPFRRNRLDCPAKFSNYIVRLAVLQVSNDGGCVLMSVVELTLQVHQQQLQRVVRFGYAIQFA
jgi:hypothetical protein